MRTRRASRQVHRRKGLAAVTDAGVQGVSLNLKAPGSPGFLAAKSITAPALAELLEHGFIARWQHLPPQGDTPAPVFHRFSRATSEAGTLLHAEYEDGKTWWTVGYLFGNTEELATLPEWSPPLGATPIEPPETTKHETIRIARGTVGEDGKDPNFETAVALMRKRGRKILDFAVDEANDEYQIRLMARTPEEMTR